MLENVKILIKICAIIAVVSFKALDRIIFLGEKFHSTAKSHQHILGENHEYLRGEK